ncbi:Dam family site-specific DNA-(adenine-N6)-methyltransferase [Agreia sp. Leaf210]|uniref:DNA adenine methylase n=1 Tax=Agreia sp. Leaf210 TaxID=1735682 RepID=UPI0012E2EB83
MTRNAAATDLASSVLRWMGSKKRSSSAIVEHLREVQSAGTYFEPFMGGGSVYFAYHPQKAVLGDANPLLMNAWRWIREDPVSLRATVASLSATETSYYEIRAQKYDSTTFESAVQFVYLNRYCFNGVYRTNRLNQFNVPFGRKTGSLPDEESFKLCATALASAALVTGDFADTLKDAVVGDIVYLDPPWRSDRANYGEYGYSQHSEVTAERIFEEASRLRSRGVHVYLSLPREMSKTFVGWGSKDFQVHYNVGSRRSARAVKTELLISMCESSNRMSVGA